MVLRSFWCQNWPQENIFLVNQPILLPNIQCVAVYWAIISPHFMKQYIQPLIRVNNYSDRYCDTLILILWPSFSCCLVQNSEMWKTLPWSNFTDFSPFKCLFRTTAMTWYWHWHWHWLTSIQIDDPQKNCANGQHLQFLKWFLWTVVCVCVLSLVHLSFSHVLDACLLLLVYDILSIQDYLSDSTAGSSEVSSVLISCRTSLVDPSAEVAWTRELYIRHEQSLNLHKFFPSEALLH